MKDVIFQVLMVLHECFESQSVDPDKSVQVMLGAAGWEGKMYTLRSPMRMVLNQW